MTNFEKIKSATIEIELLTELFYDGFIVNGGCPPDRQLGRRDYPCTGGPVLCRQCWRRWLSADVAEEEDGRSRAEIGQDALISRLDKLETHLNQLDNRLVRLEKWRNAADD